MAGATMRVEEVVEEGVFGREIGLYIARDLGEVGVGAVRASLDVGRVVSRC